jgi:hypothetical protein
MKKKRPHGRPTLYRPEYCDLLVQHLADGLSFESFGGLVDVSKQTLYDWAVAQPKFLEAKSRGESKSRLYWEKVGRDGLYNETIKDAEGSTVVRSINSTIWIFNMKNRFGWRDKTEVEVKEADAERPLEDLSDEELMRLREQARKSKR